MFDVREQFPIFSEYPDLVYLDSAASAQKPRVVIDAMSDFMTKHYANVHRGVYGLSEEATTLYEGAREKVRGFINARSTKEIVFTKNATEAINLVAYSWAMDNVQEGEIIVVTQMEHHSNYLPWQMVAEKNGARLEVIPYDSESDSLDLSYLQTLIDTYGSKVALVAVTHVSNVLGVINPIQEIVSMVRSVNGRIMVDGCQAVAHIPVDVQSLDVDFYAFSGHKLYGPTGIGVLYAKRDHLEYMHPFLRGGEMVLEVGLERTVWKELPWKFEAGTPPIVEAVGLAAAIDFVSGLGFVEIVAHENMLLSLVLEKLSADESVELIGNNTNQNRIGVISFNIKNVHAHDVAGLFDQSHICVRAGTLCAQPLVRHFGLSSTARVSLGVYNSISDINLLVMALQKVLIQLN